MKNIFRLDETANTKYQRILRRIVIESIFFLPYLSESFQNKIHQINIQAAAQATINQTLKELPQNHLTIKGTIGSMKLKPRISRKIEKSRIIIFLFIKKEKIL